MAELAIGSSDDWSGVDHWSRSFVLADESLGRLEGSLSQVDNLLRRDRRSHLRIQELRDVGEYCVSYGAFQVPQSDMNWALSRPFLLLGLLLRAFIIPSDIPKRLMFVNAPVWAFEKMKDITRAELLTGGGGAVPWAPPFHLTDAWLELMPRRWPRANALPRYILRSLGCSMTNVSLVRMLTGPDTFWGEHCRPDLAVANAEGYAEEVSKGNPFDFFTWLKPMMDVRPVRPGQALDLEMLRLVLEKHVRDPSGLFLEFGVYKGRSLDVIAKRLKTLGGGGRVYGFDSFRGLPATFRGGAGAHDAELDDLPVGHFRVDRPPQVQENAELVIGYFNESLPRFLEGRLPTPGRPQPPETIRFLHLDSDLASSTLEVLTLLAPLIARGCIMVLDDFLNFSGFREAAFRGFEEFILSRLGPRKLEVLAAPWTILPEREIPKDYRGWKPEDRFDLERAVAFRVL